MYRDEMPVIRSHGLKSPDGLADVITFVLLTIQQHLVLVPRAFEDVRSNGENSIYLFGAKRAGYRYTQEHKKGLWMHLKACAERGDTIAAMDVLLFVPSLGLVKAGFVCQMLGLPVGCLDTHNVERYGLNVNALKFSKATVKRPETRKRKIDAYIALTGKLGGAENLWNTWCAYVANPEAREGKFQSGVFASWRTADEVSQMHCRAMGLTPVSSEDIPF